MTYEPQVNHFVRWKNGISGWVYFKDKKYITIEASVRPKDEENYQCCSLHRNERLLIICYRDQWNELEYVKERETIYEEKNCVEMVGKSIG